MATNLGVKLPNPPSFLAQAFRNEWQDHNSDLRIVNTNDFCILFINLVAFDPVTSVVTRVEIATIETVGKNWHFEPINLESTGPMLAKFSGLVGLAYGWDYKSDIPFAVVQGTFLW